MKNHRTLVTPAGKPGRVSMLLSLLAGVSLIAASAAVNLAAPEDTSKPAKEKAVKNADLGPVNSAGPQQLGSGRDRRPLGNRRDQDRRVYLRHYGRIRRGRS